MVTQPCMGRQVKITCASSVERSRRLYGAASPLTGKHQRGQVFHRELGSTRPFTKFQSSAGRICTAPGDPWSLPVFSSGGTVDSTMDRLDPRVVAAQDSFVGPAYPLLPPPPPPLVWDIGFCGAASLLGSV